MKNINKDNSVLVIAGATATGKTSLGIDLARLCGGEIVSADSMQIYKGMDIGTAKATAQEQAAAVHHMIDIIEPNESYSVSRYVEDASKCCDDIISRGKLPIIVGGTGLYIDSLIRGLDFAAAATDGELRERLNARYDSEGGEAMLKYLKGFDPERSARLSPADKKRIVRAIEIYELTGETATEHDRRSLEQPPRYRAVRIVLGYADRQALYERIDRRVDIMLRQGLLEELETLLKSGVSENCLAMQAIGYKELLWYMHGEMSLDDAAALIKQSSRRYAKRQITWFGRWKDAFRINRN